MIVLTSPAKTLDTKAGKDISNTSIPEYCDEALQLARVLKNKKRKELKSLMKISDKLTELNYSRYQEFSDEFTQENSNPSIFAFRGGVYQGLNVEDLSGQDLAYAQDHIRILSGLYGILRPLDLMQPYRLEMGTRLRTDKGDDLYEFWEDKITEALNAELQHHKSKIIINLASNEYFKSINKKKLDGELYDIDFKEERDGKLKFISFNAKKARGMMMHYIIKNRIADARSLRGFDYDGYHYREDLSEDRKLVFVK